MAAGAGAKGTVGQLEENRPHSRSAAELLEQLEPGRAFFGRDGRRWQLAAAPTMAARTAAGYRVRFHPAGQPDALRALRPASFLRHLFAGWAPPVTAGHPEISNTAPIRWRP